MKYTLLLLVVIVTVAVACQKDKFTTDPQIKINKISPSDVFKGDILQIEGEFTDDEGDIDSAFIVYKYYNQAGTMTRLFDTIKNYTITSVNLPANTREGEIIINFDYGEDVSDNPEIPGTPVSPRDTLVTFGVILKDKAGHRSNYSESEKIWFKKL
jgi:hypothetical protein